MTQTYAVTGAASGIGKATKEQLEALGNRTIGIDIHDTDVVVDLATVDGREALVKEVTELSGGVLDGVAAVAGLSGPTVATAQVNYFGAVATLEGLRPLLEKADAPRAVLVSSMASLFPFDPELAVALDAGDERAAVARARALEAAGGDEGALIYGTTKRGIIRWMRRAGPGRDADDRRDGLHAREAGRDARARADAAERHGPGLGCRRGTAVPAEPDGRPPVRTDRLRRRWQ
jgi:NAD(P)-dependent dehydrogenase (short-subunit alcohol dehydrogenase family)